MRETLCTIDWEKVVRAFAALLTPTIAIVVALISFQQYRVNRLQHRLALFEKRMVVFNSTMDLIAGVVQQARVDLKQLYTFIQQTRDYDLLFGPEIGTYIDEVYHKGVDLNARAAVAGQEARTVALVEWFHNQSAEARKKFVKYLDFRKP